MIGQIQSRSGQMIPGDGNAAAFAACSVRAGRFTVEQYLSFLWKGLLQFEFGPSLMSFPTPVGKSSGLISYTLVLTLTSTLLAWIIGNFIGLQAGFRKHKRSSKIMEGIAICIYPIPYFIVALVLQIVFAFILGWFPLQATIFTFGGTAAFIRSLIRASLLPAISLLLVGTGWWIISMKSLSSTVAEEDFVLFARYRGIPEGKIGRSYVMRNSIITQVTALAMSLGGAFNGSIMTEIIFGYPGVGSLIQKAVLQSDYNTISAVLYFHRGHCHCHTHRRPDLPADRS